MTYMKPLIDRRNMGEKYRKFEEIQHFHSKPNEI
jgi:hypothetical protein